MTSHGRLSVREHGPTLRACAVLLSGPAIVSVFLVLPSSPSKALDSWDAEIAIREVRDSIDAASAILNGLPENLRRDLKTDLFLLTHPITRTLGKLEKQRPPVIDGGMIHALRLLADIMQTVSHELRTLQPAALTAVDGDVARRLDQLSAAAAAPLRQIDATIDRWIESQNDYLVEIKDYSDVIHIKKFDRFRIDIVRYIGVSLLLLGVIFAAMLIRLEKNRQPVGEFFLKKSPLSSKLLLTSFFLACLTLAVFPEILVSASASTDVAAQEDPCRTLETQSGQL
jgi:hypothetical protein